MKKPVKLYAILLATLIICSTFGFAEIVSPPEDKQIYTFEYDANGNLLNDGEYSYVYDAFNQLVKVKNAESLATVAEYFYDDQGQRIKKIVHDENGQDQTTYYVNSNFVRTVDSTGTKDTVYYYHNGALVGELGADGKKKFYHPNILGSTDVVTDASGNVVEQIEYLPYGETIAGEENSSRYTFTGQEKDAESELMYYNARYYSPFLKRFTQPDTVLQNIYDPQLLNRYAYARDNPVIYTDPSGRLIPALIAFAVATAPYWLPYLFAYTVDTAIDSATTFFEEPTLGNAVWAGLGIYDACTPGIPEGTVAKKGTKLVEKGVKTIKNVIKTTIKKASDEIYDTFKSTKEAISYYNKDPAFRASTKDLKGALSSGASGVNIKARSLDEAKAMIAKTAPNYKKVESFSGPRSQADKLIPGTYRIDELGKMAGHGAEGNIHGTYTHINMFTENKNKITIIVDAAT